jgi:hypothetical protein
MSSYKIIDFVGRNLPEQYHAMIYSKWRRSLRDGNDYFKLTEPMSFMKHYDLYIQSILNRSNVMMAVLSDDEDVCLSWAVMSGSTLHYVWTHPEGRRTGIAKSILEPFDKFTHLTKTALIIWPKSFPEAKFDPFA